MTDCGTLLANCLIDNTASESQASRGSGTGRGYRHQPPSDAASNSLVLQRGTERSTLTALQEEGVSRWGAVGGNGGGALCLKWRECEGEKGAWSLAPTEI